MKHLLILLSAILFLASCATSNSPPSATSSKHMKSITAGYTGDRGEKLKLRAIVALRDFPSGRYISTATFESLDGQYSAISTKKAFSSSAKTLEVRSSPFSRLKFPSRHKVTIQVAREGSPTSIVATHNQEFVAAGLTQEIAAQLGLRTVIEN